MKLQTLLEQNSINKQHAHRRAILDHIAEHTYGYTDNLHISQIWLDCPQDYFNKVVKLINAPVCYIFCNTMIPLDHSTSDLIADTAKLDRWWYMHTFFTKLCADPHNIETESKVARATFFTELDNILTRMKDNPGDYTHEIETFIKHRDEETLRYGEMVWKISGDYQEWFAKDEEGRAILIALKGKSI